MPRDAPPGEARDHASMVLLESNTSRSRRQWWPLGTLVNTSPCQAQAHAASQRERLVLQEMIDEADRDGDGEVNEEEFIRIMRKTSLF